MNLGLSVYKGLEAQGLAGCCTNKHLEFMVFGFRSEGTEFCVYQARRHDHNGATFIVQKLPKSKTLNQTPQRLNPEPYVTAPQRPQLPGWLAIHVCGKPCCFATAAEALNGSLLSSEKGSFAVRIAFWSPLSR